MTDLFSDAWFERVRVVLAAVEFDPPATEPLDLAVSILGGPDGDRHAIFHFAGSTVTVSGPAERPLPVASPAAPSFTVDHGAAAEINSGARSIRAAFLAGDIRLGGDARLLTESTLRLDDLGDLFAGLRD